MKKIIFLIFLMLLAGCSDDSFTFFYEVITDSPATLDILYRINGEYSYYININYSPQAGELHLFVNSALWKSEKFYAGYDIEVTGTVENPY